MPKRSFELYNSNAQSPATLLQCFCGLSKIVNILVTSVGNVYQYCRKNAVRETETVGGMGTTQGAAYSTSIIRPLLCVETIRDSPL